MAKFVMLIGLPGAGKSQYAERLKGDLRLSSPLVLASDAIRKEIFGDETIQENPERVFELMRQRTVAALANGNDVIYDATNISRKKRRHLLSQLPSCEKIACVVWARYETCIARDASRERCVGDKVIRRMLCSFQPPYFDEGWNRILFKINDEPYMPSDYENWVNCDHDNPHHANTVRKHCMQVLKQTAALPYDKFRGMSTNLILNVAAYLHDIGKKFVKAFKNSRGEPSNVAHYYNHQNVGSYFAIGYQDTLGLSTAMRAVIYWLINAHMDIFLNTKYSRNLPDDLKNLLDKFHTCDVAGA